MDEQRQDDQLEPTYNSSESIQHEALKTYQKRWTIEKGVGRGSGISVLMVRDDDEVCLKRESPVLVCNNQEDKEDRG